jgi:hypothetical protein
MVAQAMTLPCTIGCSQVGIGVIEINTVTDPSIVVNSNSSNSNAGANPLEWEHKVEELGPPYYYEEMGLPCPTAIVRVDANSSDGSSDMVVGFGLDLESQISTSLWFVGVIGGVWGGAIGFAPTAETADGRRPAAPAATAPPRVAAPPGSPPQFYGTRNSPGISGTAHDTRRLGISNALARHWHHRISVLRFAACGGFHLHLPGRR